MQVQITIIADVWKAHANYITKMQFVPQTQLLISSCKDRALKIWQVNGQWISPTQQEFLQRPQQEGGNKQIEKQIQPVLIQQAKVEKIDKIEKIEILEKDEKGEKSDKQQQDKPLQQEQQPKITEKQEEEMK